MRTARTLGLVTLATLLLGCGPGVAAPPSAAIDELSRDGGEFCPGVLPQAARGTYGFGPEQRAKSVPTLWPPQEAWICEYVSRDIAAKDANGAWLQWVRQGEPRQLDADELRAFSSNLEQLRPPTGDRACTADLGPRYLVSFAYRRDLTGVVIDDYGCAEVRLTDDPFATVPGVPTQPGTVPGVLRGPAGFLDALHVR